VERPATPHEPSDTSFLKQGGFMDRRQFLVRFLPVCPVLLLALLHVPVVASPPNDTTRAPASDSVFLVEPVAEKVVDRLPGGSLHWRVERFPSLMAARAAEGPWSIAAEAWGEAWLLTLGLRGSSTPDGLKIAEIGPVTVPAARRFLLRMNTAGGPPGAKTPVHSHPGSEAFFVLKGELTQCTSHGVSRVQAGEVMNGHQPGMIMQLESTGTEPLAQLVMFVVDAEKPFSSPAHFDEP
jgi:quercetin dioxygenase-like cupin family protein